MRPSRILIIVLVVAMVATAFTWPRPAQVVGWEYHIVRAGNIDITANHEEQQVQMQQSQAMMNELGAKGWELVDVESPFAVFRRAR